MPIQKSIPMQRIISGKVLKTSEITVVTDSQYKTNGELLVLCRTNENIEIILDNTTTDHVIIKSMTNTKIKPLTGKIDEEFDEINIEKGASVELYLVFNNWYVVSSDGLKNS